MNGKSTKDVKSELVCRIKSRIFELQQELAKVNRPEDRMSKQDAIANNISWLIQLGQPVDYLKGA